MRYKQLLESAERPYRETLEWKHFKNPELHTKYFENYLSYKKQPHLKQLKDDIDYLADEQADYSERYAFLFFAENEELTDEMSDYLSQNGFDLVKHIIFTSKIDHLQLSNKDVSPITITRLSEVDLNAYVANQYEANLIYGKAYADQMRHYNENHLLQDDSVIYLAKDGAKIVGALTAWYFGDYVEMDDFHVHENYRGRGIGSALQAKASEGIPNAILIAEEENRDMYQHQGYRDVAYYWTALKSDMRSRDV